MENICSDVQSKIASYTSKAMKKLVLTKFTKNGLFRPTKEKARYIGEASTKLVRINFKDKGLLCRANEKS